MQRLSQACVVMAITLLIAACGSGQDPDQAEPGTSAPITSEAAPPTTAEPSAATTSPTTTALPTTTTTTLAPPLTWTRDDLDAVGRVVHNGTIALTVVRSDAQLEILAVDVTTGDELWRAPYSMGGRFPGMGLGGFDISGETMAHMDGTLANPRTAELVGRDLTTGEELWRIDAPLGFGAEGCGVVYCAAWADLSRGHYIVSGVDPRSGEQAWTLDGGDIDYITDPDLAIVLAPGNEPLIHAVEPETGTVRWTLDPEALFDRDMTTNNGWNFRREEGVVMVTLNRPFNDDTILATTFGLDETGASCSGNSTTTGSPGGASTPTPCRRSATGRSGSATTPWP